MENLSILHGEIVTALMGVDTDFDGAVDNGMVELWAKDLNRGSYSKCVGGALRFSFSSDVNDMKRTFTCDDLGENQVKMWVTDATGEQSYCITTVTIQNNGANIPDCHRKVEEPENQNMSSPEKYWLSTMFPCRTQKSY